MIDSHPSQTHNRAIHGLQQAAVAVCVLTCMGLSSAAESTSYRPAATSLLALDGSALPKAQSTLVGEVERQAPPLLPPLPPPGRIRQDRSAFEANAAAAGPVASGIAARNDTPQRSSTKLFDLNDRAIIIVSGRKTTAGELKGKLLAEIDDKAGPPRTVKVGQRKLDLARLNVTRAAVNPASSLQGKGAAASEKRASKFTPAAPMPPALSTYSEKSPAPSPFNRSAAAGATVRVDEPAARMSERQMALATQVSDPSASITAMEKPNKPTALKSMACPDRGPPKIFSVLGHLKPGSKFRVEGLCFGDRTGRVELIGQFPGGKLVVPFTSWDMNSVDLEMPATIRGAGDHTVAVTVITADGKASPAMQAEYQAARERVAVPDRLWSPNSSFELAATDEAVKDGTLQSVIPPGKTSNAATSGRTAKSLRVNPQCALDNVEATLQSGSIDRIKGWELGRPNEADVSLDWTGTCIQITTTTSSTFSVLAGKDVTIRAACRIKFQLHAWAYCPVGMAP